MKIEAIGFSHRGTIRENNQDAILMHDQVYQSGTHQIEIDGDARFFVADGVGGAPAGEVASRFVLSQTNTRFMPGAFPDEQTIADTFRSINASFFDYCNLNPQFNGMASTLSGLFISQGQVRVFNAGDSCVLFYRDKILTQITKPDVIQINPESPVLANYFGGYHDSLNPVVLPDVLMLQSGDQFIITSDGIFHCFPINQLEKILGNSKTLSEKAAMILEKSLDMGSPDNISCIFIRIT
jgi:protein phosphatase